MIVVDIFAQKVNCVLFVSKIIEVSNLTNFSRGALESP